MIRSLRHNDRHFQQRQSFSQTWALLVLCEKADYMVFLNVEQLWRLKSWRTFLTVNKNIKPWTTSPSSQWGRTSSSCCGWDGLIWRRKSRWSPGVLATLEKVTFLDSEGKRPMEGLMCEGFSIWICHVSAPFTFICTRAALTSEGWVHLFGNDMEMSFDL